MARTPVSVSTRVVNGKKVYVARFFDSSGHVIRSRTFSKAKSPAAAAREAEKYLREGVIANATNPDAIEYLRSFWKRDSDYVRGRALRGIELGEEYLSYNLCVLNKHLAPRIKGKQLLDLDASFIERYILDASAEGASPRTVNGVLNAVRVPMKYFCKQNRIPNPLSTVECLAEHPRPRGILSVAELQKIVALNESPRVKAGVLLGALCGLRLGEVVGLMPKDIDRKESMLTIRHNYVGKKVKGPKGSRAGAIRVRQVPLPAPVLAALDACASLAPKGCPFVLWNDRDNSRPIDRDTLQGGFARILEKIGIDESQRKARNLVFHGLRHTFVSLQRANGIPDFVTARLSGHRSVEMLDGYSREAGEVLDFNSARRAIEDAMEEKAARG